MPKPINKGRGLGTIVQGPRIEKRKEKKKTVREKEKKNTKCTGVNKEKCIKEVKLMIKA